DGAREHQRLRRGFCVEPVRDPTEGRMLAAAHQARRQRRRPVQYQHHTVPRGGGAFLSERELTLRGKVPGYPGPVTCRAAQLIRHPDEMCGSLIFDFAPMLHRFCQAAVPVVLSDEPLDVGSKLELETACTRVIGPEKGTR